MFQGTSFGRNVPTFWSISRMASVNHEAQPDSPAGPRGFLTGKNSTMIEYVSGHQFYPNKIVKSYIWRTRPGSSIQPCDYHCSCSLEVSAVYYLYYWNRNMCTVTSQRNTNECMQICNLHTKMFFLEPWGTCDKFTRIYSVFHTPRLPD